MFRFLMFSFYHFKIGTKNTTEKYLNKRKLVFLRIWRKRVKRMEWQEWEGKKVYIETRSNRRYTGKIIKV